MSAADFLAALKAEGVEVVEVGDWEHHNRNSKGPWGPVNGVVIHHTVTRGTQTTIDICRDGYAALPGPLCHGVIAKSGKVYLVGYGRANHAGLGDPDVLKAVIDERKVPVDNQATVDGNRHFYGFECENMGDGKDPWPEVQLEAIERVSAALCRKHGWGELSVIGHLEWQPGKSDPRGFTMDSMRNRVRARLADKPGGSTPPPSTGTTYVVKAGDTLSGIAKKLGVTVDAMLAANRGTIEDADEIFPGQKLVVPKGPTLPSPVKPKVDLSLLIAAARSNPKTAGTPITYAGVKTVEAVLVNEGLLAKAYLDGHFGTATVEAYRKWQIRCDFTGSDADGIPGMSSLTKLGEKHGFTVVA
jgi:hypothetical protein